MNVLTLEGGVLATSPARPSAVGADGECQAVQLGARPWYGGTYGRDPEVRTPVVSVHGARGRPLREVLQRALPGSEGNHRATLRLQTPGLRLRRLDVSSNKWLRKLAFGLPTYGFAYSV